MFKPRPICPRLAVRRDFCSWICRTLLGYDPVKYPPTLQLDLEMWMLARDRTEAARSQVQGFFYPDHQDSGRLYDGDVMLDGVDQGPGFYVVRDYSLPASKREVWRLHGEYTDANHAMMMAEIAKRNEQLAWADYFWLKQSGDGDKLLGRE